MKNFSTYYGFVLVAFTQDEAVDEIGQKIFELGQLGVLRSHAHIDAAQPKWHQEFVQSFFQNAQSSEGQPIVDFYVQLRDGNMVIYCPVNFHSEVPANSNEVTSVRDTMTVLEKMTGVTSATFALVSNSLRQALSKAEDQIFDENLAQRIAEQDERRKETSQLLAETDALLRKYGRGKES